MAAAVMAALDVVTVPGRTGVTAEEALAPTSEAAAPGWAAKEGTQQIRRAAPHALVAMRPVRGAC